MTTATMAAATMAATTASVCVNLGRSERGKQAKCQDDCISQAPFSGNILVPFIEMVGCEENSLASLRHECRTGSSSLRSLIEFPLTQTESESGSTGPVSARRTRRREHKPAPRRHRPRGTAVRRPTPRRRRTLPPTRSRFHRRSGRSPTRHRQPRVVRGCQRL